MRTTPPIDQNQLRHTATEAQKQNINSEARGVDDFVPLIAQAIKVCVEFTVIFIYLVISGDGSTAITSDGGFVENKYMHRF